MRCENAVTNPSSFSAQKPSGTEEQRRALVAAAELLAKVLDTTVKIPGTSLYLGLDPLIGLIPGLGDVLANLMGAVILGLAARLDVPRIVITRMSLNLLINGVVGAVPVLGDLFSVWFQSNMRNAALLRDTEALPGGTVPEATRETISSAEANGLRTVLNLQRVGWPAERSAAASIDDAIDKYVVDGAVNGVGGLTREGGRLLRRIETGRIQTYLYGAALGSLLVVLLNFLFR